MISKSRIPASLLVAGVPGLILVMSVAYGFQYRYHSDLAAYFQLASAPFFLIIVAMSAIAFRRWDLSVARLSWQPWLGMALMSLCFVLTAYFYSRQLLDPVPWPVAAILVPGLAWYCTRQWGTRGGAGVFLGITLALYALMVARIPHTPGANMLQIIEAAAAELLAGRNPMGFYDPSISNAAFYYLPGLWLPYAGLVALGVEVRILNLVCLLLLVAMFRRLLSAQEHADNILSVTFYPLILSPPVAQMVLHGHVWPYWVLVVLTMLLVHRERYLAAAAAFGLCLAARQPALFIALPLAIYVYRVAGFKSTLWYGLITALAYSVVIVPFAIWSGPDFWNLTYLQLANVDGTVQPHLSAVSLFGPLADAGLPRYAQLATLLLTAALIVKRDSISFVWFLLVTGLLYVWLVFLSLYPVRYVYFPGFLMIAMALTLWLGRAESISLANHRLQPSPAAETTPGGLLLRSTTP